MDSKLNTSDQGIDLIKYFEGTKLEAYQDTGGIWTIGVGHTSGVEEGMKITDDDATKLLKVDLIKAKDRVYEFITIPLVQYELDSLVSQAFNLRSFPTLASHLNKDRTVYLDKLLLYCHDAKGNTLKGLQTRRKAEQLMFLGMPWVEIKERLNL